MKNIEVIYKFIENENAKSHTNSLKSIDGYLYSYNLKIAKKINNFFVIYPATKKYFSYHYSNTTSRHIGLLLKTIPESERLFIDSEQEFNLWNEI